jgi:hypothetical protein
MFSVFLCVCTCAFVRACKLVCMCVRVRMSVFVQTFVRVCVRACACAAAFLPGLYARWRRRAPAGKISEKSHLQRPCRVEYARALTFQILSPQPPCPSVAFIAAPAALAALPPPPSAGLREASLTWRHWQAFCKSPNTDLASVCK